MQHLLISEPITIKSFSLWTNPRLSIDTQFFHLMFTQHSNAIFLANEEMYVLWVTNFFMKFVKTMKFLWIFEAIVKKIHINYKIYSQTLILLLLYV
jgi:hypothetical protein